MESKFFETNTAKISDERIKCKNTLKPKEKLGIKI